MMDSKEDRHANDKNDKNGKQDGRNDEERKAGGE